MNISILETINSDLAINLSDGIHLYNSIKDKKPSDIVISFIGIRRISTAFLNESIGRYAIENKNNIEGIQFLYPQDKSLFNHKVKDVIENALMGDEYDTLIDSALLSL